MSDPERATQNLIDRDLLMGQHITERARELGLTVYEIDGTKGLDEGCPRRDTFRAVVAGIGLTPTLRRHAAGA